MNVLLLHPDRDFAADAALPWNAPALAQDLALDVLIGAMAGGDPVVFEVSRQAILNAVNNDIQTILYRQAVLRDCLENPAVVRELYALAVEVLERKRARWFGFFTRYPAGILYEAIELLRMLLEMLRRLRRLADSHAGRFASAAFTALFSTIRSEVDDAWLESVRGHLKELRFRGGVLLSAELGEGNAGGNYVLRRDGRGASAWLSRLLGRSGGGYTFRLHPRDDAGARIVSEIRDAGINRVANALAQSAEHVLNFFVQLRTELAFYIGCLNLRDRLSAAGEPLCFPVPAPAGTRRLRFDGLYDACLSLTMGRRVVGNAADADGRDLVVITGANQGGKSVFLRSIGLAQLMMQCGMFVPAASFEAEICTGLFTHWRREEDPTMRHGKLDEELARMSEIADHLAPDAMVLFNESFAATNDREGSEIAGQIVAALLEKRVRVFFVTHLHEFPRRMFERAAGGALFLRAERLPDGTRTFRVVPGEPLLTSYAEDVYRAVFQGEGADEPPDASEPSNPAPAAP